MNKEITAQELLYKPPSYYNGMDYNRTMTWKSIIDISNKLMRVLQEYDKLLSGDDNRKVPEEIKDKLVEVIDDIKEWLDYWTEWRETDYE